MKKKINRLLCVMVLCCTAAILLSGTASANSAPPDYMLVVRLANAPEEPYYLDLLVPDQAGQGPDEEIMEDPPLDAQLLETLLRAVPEGWTAYTCQIGVNTYWGDLAGENGVHRFRDMDVPEKFRIAAAAESGETWVSDTMERRVLQDAVTVDWSAKKVSAPPVWLAVGLQTLSTLLPTLVIEGLVLLAFRFDWKKNRKVFLLTNLVTQGALAVFLSTQIVRTGLGSYGMLFYSFILTPFELLIAFAEAVVYDRFFLGYTSRRAFVYGITANVVSYLVGLFTVEAIWENFVKALWMGI